MAVRTSAQLTFFVDDPQVEIRIDTVRDHPGHRVVQIGMYEQTALSLHCDDEFLARLRDVVDEHLGGAA